MLDAEDLTIQAVNPAYKQFLGDREVKGLPRSEVFSGKQLDELIKVLKSAARDGQTAETGPILAGVDTVHNPANARFVHTVVPIPDAAGSTITRLFVYSEQVK